MNASEVIRYIETHCPPSAYRADVVSWCRSWEGPPVYVVNTPNENVEAPKMVVLSEGFEDPRKL